MAGKLKGIVIEIGGDTVKLEKALEGVNKHTRDLQSELKGVESLLKKNPGNTELLAQKQQLLTEAIAETAQKLDTLTYIIAEGMVDAANKDATLVSGLPVNYGAERIFK